MRRRPDDVGVEFKIQNENFLFRLGCGQTSAARNSLQRAAIRSHVLEKEKGRSEFGPCSIHIDPLVWLVIGLVNSKAEV